MSLGAFFNRKDEALDLLSQKFAPRIAVVGALIARTTNLGHGVEQSASFAFATSQAIVLSSEKKS